MQGENSPQNLFGIQVIVFCISKQRVLKDFAQTTATFPMFTDYWLLMVQLYINVLTMSRGKSSPGCGDTCVV